LLGIGVGRKAGKKERSEKRAMISYVTTEREAPRVRFSLSPLGEAVYSFRMLASPERRKPHRIWFEAIRSRLAENDLRLLRAVVPPTGYVPDFLTPPPGLRSPDFAEELEVVRSTRPEHFVDEVTWMVNDPATPTAWRTAAGSLHRQMLASPEKAIRRITDLLDRYWRAALEPCWKRLRGSLLTDIRSRTRVMENTGVAPVLSSLNDRVGWDGTCLTVRSGYDFRENLDEQGIVLVPSVFCGPEVLTMLPPQQAMLVYPRPGAAEVWQRQESRRPSPLSALLGGIRAAVLEALVTPATTSELAVEIGVTPGAVSQHLGVLRECGLVVSRRAGRQVLHSLTEMGEALLRGADPRHRTR